MTVMYTCVWVEVSRLLQMRMSTVHILYTCIYMGGRVKWENVTMITIRTNMEVPLLTLTNGVAVYVTTMIHAHILER